MPEGRENYFILLNLDPERSYSNQEIESSIKTAQGDWSRKLKTSKGERYKQYLQWIDDIRVSMADKGKRMSEASEAKKLIADKKAELQREIVQSIERVTVGGYIDSKDLERIIKLCALKEEAESPLYKNILNAQKIEEFVNGEVVEENENPAALPVKIQMSILEKRQGLLNLLKKKDFYDLLELDEHSSTEKLGQVTHKELSDAGIVARITPTAENNAKLSLLSQANTAFASDQERQKYDIERSVAPLLSLWKEMAGLPNIVSYKVYEDLFNEGLKLGGKPEIVEWLIHDTANPQGIAPEKKKKIYSKKVKKFEKNAKEILQCGICLRYNVYHASENLQSALCSGCGEPLYLECPKCKNKVATTGNVCDKCGQSIADRIRAIRLTRECNDAFMYNALSKAKRMVSEALRLWPSYEKGKEAEAKIQKELQKIKPLEEKCEKALSRKCLMDAKVALSELEKAAIDHPLLEKKEMVESQIASADELVQKAKATIDLRAKEKLLLEALAISSQCVEPRDMPLPAPPSDLKMSVGQSNIHLSWQASPSIGNIRYRVMRKENGHPNSPEDGKELATVDILNYTDSGITPGVSYYYAVYSVRQNSFSSERQTAGPAIQVAGVSDFKAVSGNKMVTLKWKAPKASVVTIRRKEKNAADSSEIVLCEGFSGEEFVDAKNVENETFYTYTVQTFFSNGQSGSQASYTVCPTLPPTPIIDLKIAKENQAEPQKRVLSWTPAASNTVTKIVQTQSKLPDCNEGQFYTLSEANAWGKTVSILKEGFAEPMLESGMNYFIPLTIKGDAVVCGKIASVPYVQGLQNVIGDGIDDTVTLRWQWPTGVKNALITYAYDAFPQEPSPQSCAASEEVMGKEDSSSCETKFCVSQKCPHYFSVFAYVSIGGKKYFSLPSKVQVLLGNVPIISYRIVKKGLFKQRFYVELRSDPADEFALPDLQLRVKASEVPFDQTDGVLLSNVSNVTLQNGHALIDVPESESKSGRYLKIFFKDSKNGEKYRLRAEKRDYLRVK